MSKERELLVRAKVLLECSNMQPLQGQADLIIREVEELLAQPEQTEQEPVAWMQDSIELYVLEEKSAIRGYVIPLYTAPQNRNPIDTRRITLKMFSEGIDINYKDGYVDGVKFAEKAHGIGGGE